MFRKGILLILLASLLVSCVDEAPTIKRKPNGGDDSGYDTGTDKLLVEAIYPEDPSPPSVLADAPVDTDLIIMFSKPVEQSTINSTNIQITPALSPPGLSVDSFFANDKGVRITLTAGGPLIYNQEYTVTIQKGPTGVKAADGNELLATGMYQYQFTTGTDTSSDLDPRVIAVTRYPADAATVVSRVLPYVEVTFTKEMDPTTVTTASFQVIDNSVPVNISASITNVDNRTFQANVPALSYGQDYAVNLTAAITDDPAYGSNSLVLDGNETWSFTVEDDPDSGTQNIDSVWIYDVSDTTATIYFTTNKPVATEQCSIDFGISTAYGSSTTGSGTTPETVHSITISLPTPATRYYFQINVPTIAPQSTDPATGNMLAFITEDDPGSSDDTEVSDLPGNKSELMVLQHNNLYSFDGSSFVVWKDDDDNIYGSFFDSDTVPTKRWGTDGSAIDSGFKGRSNIRLFTDFLGRILVTLEGSGNIYAKLIYNSSGSIAFDSNWGTAGSNGVFVGSGTNPAAVFIWGDQGNNNVYDGFVAKITSGMTEMDIPSNPFYDFSQNLYNEASNDILYRNSSNFGQPYISSNYRHVMGQNPNIGIVPGVNYYVGDLSDNSPFLTTNHTMVSDDYLNGGSTLVGPFGYTWAGTNDIIDDGPGYGRITNTSLISETLVESNIENATNRLVDANTAPFGGVAVDDFVYNVTDNTYTYVSSVYNIRELGLVNNRFVWGENYEVYRYRDSGTSSTPSFEQLTKSGGVDWTTVVQLNDYAVNLDTGSSARCIDVIDANTIDLDDDIFTSAGANYVIIDDTTLASGTMNRTNHVYNRNASWTSTVNDGDLVVNTDSGQSTTVRDVRSDRLLWLWNNRFTGGNKNYAIYRDWDTSNVPTTATPRSFEVYTIDHSVGIGSGVSVTVYNLRDSGIADDPPTNPLFDNDDNLGSVNPLTDVVINMSDLNGPPDPNISIIDTFFDSSALDLAQNIMANNERYWVLGFDDLSETSNVIESGYATSYAANELRSTVSDFVSAAVERGDLVYNIFDDTYAVVMSRDNATRLTLDWDIFNDGDEDFIIFACDQQLIETGTVTSISPHFIDSNANFSNVNVGDLVHNNDSGSDAYITAIAGQQLTLNEEIMTSVGQHYVLMQPRVLFAYERGGNIYGRIIGLRDGNDYFGEINICTAAGTQSNVRVVERGFRGNYNGGAFVIYESGSNIYAKLIDGNGTVIGGGASLGTSIASVTVVQVLSESRDMFYLLSRDGSTIRLSSINNTLTENWGKDFTADDAAMMITPSYYITIAYSEDSAYPDDGKIFIEQFDSAGTNQYAKSDVVTLTPYAHYSNLSITPARNGDGAIVSWIDERYFPSLGFVVMAQYVDGSGIRQWNADAAGSDLDGILIGIPGAWETGDAYLKALFYNDGSGPWGGLFIWYDYRNLPITDADIYYDIIANP